MPVYTFDTYFAAQVTVQADKEEAARAALSQAVNGQEATLGPLPSGAPLRVTLGLDGDPMLSEIDGRQADGAEPQ